MIIVPQSARIEEYTPNAEKVIERAARTCYKSEGKCSVNSHINVIKMLKKNGHTSVFEHASAGFVIVTNRAIGNEIVRHRAGCSYSQTSTRYVNYAKSDSDGNISVIQPVRRDGNLISGDAENAWKTSVHAAELAYFTMVRSGEAPEIARDVLPLCLATEIYMTANFRAWLHFLNLRLKGTTGRPHPQIIELSKLIAEQLVKIAPTVFSDFEQTP